jgi:hypothetical protein
MSAKLVFKDHPVVSELGTGKQQRQVLERVLPGSHLLLRRRKRKWYRKIASACRDLVLGRSSMNCSDEPE